MLLALAVVATLALLLLPAFRSMREAGTGAECLSRLRQTGVTLRAYMVDNRNAFPPANPNTVPGIGWSGLWYQSTDGARRGPASYAGGAEAMKKIATCPLNRRDHNLYPYIVNYNVMIPSGRARATSFQQIASPSTIVWMMDSALPPDWRVGLWGRLSGWKGAGARHTSRTNVLWTDGHATSVDKENDLLEANFYLPYLP